MFRTEKVQIEIDASTQTAVRQIAKLQQEYDDLRPKIDDARKAVDKASTALEKFSKADRNPSNQKWKDAYDKYYQADKAYRNLKESSDRYNLSIEQQVKELGLAGLSNKELNKYLTEQTRLLNSARRGTDEYADSLEKLKKAKAEKAIRTTDIAGEKSFMDNMKGGFMPALIGGVAGGLVAQAGEIVGALFSTIQGMILKKAEFAKAMGGLAAITGLDPKKDAKDLEYYASSARAMGKEFGVASLEIIKTIQIVGSLKPELLSQKEALVGVTEDIIILSKASGDILSIEDSAKAVTGALNQFGESADQSTRFINVLAAGAKAGSSEINQTAAAFKVSGLILKTSNISFEQSNALVQALSSKMIMGEHAGTNLRNIFSKLLTGTDELNPAIVGLDKSLEGLSKKSPAEMVKLFGQENITAAMTLVNMRGEVDKLTKAVTNTNEALDQKNKWTDNLSGDIDKLSTSWSAMWNGMMSSSDGFWRSFIQRSTSALDWISEKMKNTTMTFQGGMVPIGFNYDSSGAEKDRQKKTQDAKLKDFRKTGAIDVRDSNAYWEGKVQGKTIDQKKINASKETVRVSREAAVIASNKFSTARAKAKRSTNLSSYAQKAQKDKIAELEDVQNLSFTKLKIAKEESARLVKNAEENAVTLRKIKEGNARQAIEDAKKGAKGKKGKTEAEKLAEDQAATQAKVNAEILKSQIERISNENDKKEAQIRFQYNEDVEAHLKLIAEKKLSQAQYDTWIIERNLLLDNALAENDKQASEKVFAEAKKVNLKVAKEKLDDAKDTENKKLKLAKQTDDLAEQEAIEGQILFLDKELALLEATEDRKLEILRKYEADKLLLKEKFDDLFNQKQDKKRLKDEEIKRKADEAQKKLYNDISQGINMASSLTAELFNFEKQAIDNQIIKEDKRFNQKMANLENQKNQGIITEEEYNTQKTKFEKEHDDNSRELKKKAFEADKKARIAQIIMATAQAVIQALATGGIFGTIGAIAAGVTGAAQLAIAASQEAPEFAEGDFTDNPKSYSAKKPTKQAKLAWVNEYGPEFISNNNAVTSPDFPMMLPLLRKMNRGEMIMPDLKAMFMPQTMQAYAQGDYTSRQTSPQGNVSTQVNTPKSPDFDLKRLTLALETFNDNCEKGTFAKVFFAHKDIKDLEILKTQTQALENRASAKNGNTTF